MTDEQIQELVLAFLDQRGGYVAGASERELLLMVRAAVMLERQAFIDMLGQELIAAQDRGYFSGETLTAAILRYST